MGNRLLLTSRLARPSITSVALAGISHALVTRVSAKLVMAAGMGLVGGGIL